MTPSRQQQEQTPVAPSLAEALRLHQAGRLVEAEKLYLTILAADPRHARCLHLLGMIALRTARPALAVDRFLASIAVDGTSPATHAGLGDALRAQGRPAEACVCYRQAILLNADFAEAYHNWGLALRARSREAEAASAYRRALALAPGLPQIYHNLGLVLASMEQWRDAFRCFLHALRLAPVSPEAHYNLGNALIALGRREDAIDCFRRALRLRPDYGELLVNLGNALRDDGRSGEAIACYVRAMAVTPNGFEALNNLGNALKDGGAMEAALAAYRSVVTVRPDFAEGHYNLGLALRALGCRDAADASFRRALALEPDYAECRLVRTMDSLPILAETPASSLAAPLSFDLALDDLAVWAKDHGAAFGDAVGSAQPFYLAYRPGDHRGRLSRFGDLAAAAAKIRWQGPRIVQERGGVPRHRLRIGIVSAQIRRHPVWDVVLRGIIDGLDRRRFEVFLYQTRPESDEETIWAAGRVAHFEQGPKTMASWLADISAHRPDILFYPEIGMDPATSALAALRLAPLQVAGWGHPITTGLPTIDLFFSGALLEGAEADRHYREKLVRLPGTGVCTKAFAVDTVPIDPVSLGLPADRATVRFALCHTPFKFDPGYDHLYVQIAKAAGACQFWLSRDAKYPWASDRLFDRLAGAFRSEGLDPGDYLRMLPWLPPGKFGGFLQEMDIYLDSPAFSGYTTAWQAAHGGLPIITLEGAFLRQRLAAGVLRQIGQNEGIVASEEAYAALAVRWAGECRKPAPWLARREALRLAAPRADGNRRAVRAFEQALIDATKAAQ
ncbi:tetratricopeptide repeat protein [Telmatospirillum siberiense]|uniref:protein O-GlcNAc transferase n=1 Tax=Telmatospirillum siberiense TaxID=382514 RepID=A0A2N3PUU3_9PROT|nr:tetratricopeptide repeat protein [Telmatospirillum siberiense]PKU24160.1 zinc chelation protein SecC [Telmatospirillum siberiense]